MARYKDLESYIGAVEESVRKLVADRLLLSKDGEAYADLARRMVWPPEPVDTYPFWKLEAEKE